MSPRDGRDTGSHLTLVGGAHRPTPRHPLTTWGTPVLPPRARGEVDVWEELDSAAATVAAEWPAEGRAEVWQALRVLCVALRAGGAAAAGAATGTPSAPAPPADYPALRIADVPWEVPVGELAARLRRRLVAQATAHATATPASAGTSSVLALVAALDAVEQAARTDGARTALAQLGGAHALELLVEVAHDMRSPLGSILFLVERVRAGAVLDAASDRHLALVHGAAYGLSALVSDVMELARGGDGLARGTDAALSVDEVLDEVRVILAPLAEEKGLAFALTGDVPGARLGRAGALQRVLLNLTTNALKFTPRGRVTVSARSAGADRVRFEIADTGPGIPSGVRAQLFQTFRERQGATGLVFSSAGLGLAISQRLVASMGGQLGVESAPGAGTTFAFEIALPLAGG